MKKVQEVQEIRPGQIRRILYGSPSRQAFGIIVGKPFQLKGQLCVRVLPAHVLPGPGEVDDSTDIVIEPERSPAGVGFLIEWWNERPVLVSRLAGLFGVVPDGVYSCLDWVLRYPERMTDPTAESVKLFRERERERWDRLSADSKQLCC